MRLQPNQLQKSAPLWTVHHQSPLPPTILRTADRVVIIGDAAHVELPSDAQGSLERWLTDEPSKRGIDGKERMDLIRDDLERRIDELAVELRSTKNP